ncbi:MAG TPA: hypothetical protein VL475_13325, partial [Planctomycetaceae bacterium]|nr:hypothetical protein [Planctomycetaceae bacterium]
MPCWECSWAAVNSRGKAGLGQLRAIHHPAVQRPRKAINHPDRIAAYDDPSRGGTGDRTFPPTGITGGASILDYRRLLAHRRLILVLPGLLTILPLLLL